MNKNINQIFWANGKVKLTGQTQQNHILYSQNYTYSKNLIVNSHQNQSMDTY